MPTRQHLASDRRGAVGVVFFSPDGREVWSGSDKGDLSGWKIIEGSEPDIITDGGWVLSPSGKRLLWLPPRWRSHRWDRVIRNTHTPSSLPYTPFVFSFKFRTSASE
ncbi:hypothetical protein BDM02DRAFT_3123294 [Thelephora ganbajun]|uniref:Uncharacterized protein n=1 Tax=Thelephora ganbajun TaxID=370292 RepID=A0ACB6Z1I6_THEGA|nr:hypothetical protein BDM02DRAFT_3123294 [Thelephora ganbajun]